MASGESKTASQGSDSKDMAGVAPPASGLVPPGIAQAPGGNSERSGGTAAGKEVAREGDRTPGEGLSPEDLDAEIRRLKSLRKEALERERALAEKADAFRARLRRMLEERD